MNGSRQAPFYPPLQLNRILNSRQTGVIQVAPYDYGY